MAEPSSRPRPPSSQSTPQAALAELAVGHIAHPTTLVRSAAIVVVARALKAGNDHVVDALERFSRAATTDDALECAGRCLAAARCDDTFAVPQSLQYLERALAEHPNRALRDLAAATPTRPYRQLRHAYLLDLPSPDTALIESGDTLIERSRAEARRASLGLPALTTDDNGERTVLTVRLPAAALAELDATARRLSMTRSQLAAALVDLHHENP